MTIHKLTKPGSRRLACGHAVPDSIRVGTNAQTWDDGAAGTASLSLCLDGCYPELTKPSPLVTHKPAALQRFSVVSTSSKTQLGNAVVNRDGTISCYLGELPVDGKLTLVPA